MNYIFDLHQKMLSEDLILVYEGEFTQEITKSVLAMAERNMDSSGVESSIKRKVFNVMVECLQNIVKHADQFKGNDHIKSAIFMIGKKDDTYIVMSGNAIENEHIESLQERLNTINSQDKEGLKSMYKEIIKNTEISDKGGAGLGFIDMARKSGNQLDYKFFDMAEGISFFCLKTTIGQTD